MKKVHSDATRAGAIATALVTGSTSLASQATGVPTRTLQHWLQQYENGTLGRPDLEERVAELIDEEQLIAQTKMVGMVRGGVEVLAKAVEHWSDHADELTPNQMKDLAVVVGIIQDKSQALAGRPTSTTMRYNVNRTENYTANPLLVPTSRLSSE